MRPVRAVTRRRCRRYRGPDPEVLTAVLESPATVTVRVEYAGYRVVIGPDPHEVTGLESTDWEQIKIAVSLGFHALDVPEPAVTLVGDDAAGHTGTLTSRSSSRSSEPPTSSRYRS